MNLNKLKQAVRISTLIGLSALTFNSYAQTALDRSSWSLSSNRNQADLFSAIDGNANTRWSTNERQRDGQFFQVDLSSTTEISRIVLDTSGSSNDYPRDYEVSVSTDGSNFTTIADGTQNSSITDISFSDINARFVRIDQNGSDNRFWWSIHEINIFGEAGNQSPPSGSENLALSGSASQSSVSHNGQPSRAIDGDTNGRYRDRSVTHTNANQPNNAFWQVELEESSDIGQIVIWNRTDSCCEDRLSDFTVRVLNDNGATVYSQFFADHPEPTLTINLNNITGSTVRVELDGILSLAEVQVFGNSDEQRPEPQPEPRPELPDGLHPDITRILDIPRSPRTPRAGYSDSYSVGDRCYCETNFDHDLGPIRVDTPVGNISVREACDLIGPGPGSEGRPVYNDAQCGNGPPNTAIDETQCPGRVDLGRDGCNQAGPLWNFN